jgi:hypothetical protein
MKPLKLSTKLLLIVATASVAVVAYFVWQWQKRDSIDTRYKNTLAQLLQPRKDGDPNSASHVSLLTELGELIALKSDGDAALRQKLRGEVTRSFTELFKSHSFDLNQGSNVELETTVLVNWPEYVEHLSANSQDNVWIMYQYSLALQNLGKKEPAIVDSAVPQADGSLTYRGKANDDKAAALMQKLNAGYRLHVDLLRKLPEELNKKYLLTSFCWYRDAINNPLLAGHVFRYDETQVRAEELRCKDAGQSVKVLN